MVVIFNSATYNPCDSHSSHHAQPLAHIMSFSCPSLLQAGKQAPSLVSYQVVGPGLGPGSFLWACPPVSKEGAGAEAGAAAAGGSGHQPAGPVDQDPSPLVGQQGKVF